MVLVDTDVFSFLFKGDSRAENYRQDLEGRTVCLSFMSVAELKRWALAHSWGRARADRLEAAMRRLVVFPFDLALADAWARITVARARAGRPIASGDCWIAATAVRHGMPLVTHNSTDYQKIETLKVITHH